MNDNTKTSVQHALSLDEIGFAYRLFLGRAPSTAEAERMQANVTSVEGMRRVFLMSAEFSKRYSALVKSKPATVTVKEQNSLVIHLHIPKTAGTSLNSILAQNFAPEQVLTTYEADLKKVADMPLETRRRLRLVRGHIFHGVAALFPQPAIYICVLRRPGPRIFSFYQFVKRSKTHPLHLTLNEGAMSFGDFLKFAIDESSLRNQMDNGQIRWLANRMDPRSVGQEPEIFDQALANLRAPDMMFGLTEHFDLFLDRLVAAGIIRHAPSVRHNVSPPGTEYDDVIAALSVAERALFEDFIYWDNRLYDICKADFFAQSAAGKEQQ